MGGLLTCPKLCSLPQSKTTTKKCLVFVKSVCIHRPCPYIYPKVPRSLPQSHSKPVAVLHSCESPSSLFVAKWSSSEEEQSGGQKEEESSAVFAVWSLGGVLSARHWPPVPPLPWTVFQSEEKQIRRWSWSWWRWRWRWWVTGGVGAERGRGGGGRLCQSPVISAQSQRLLLLHCSFLLSRMFDGGGGAR